IFNIILSFSALLLITLNDSNFKTIKIAYVLTLLIQALSIIDGTTSNSKLKQKHKNTSILL
ncbi:MAG: hypothetical protein Q4B52_07425, partial [Tissierellia bacterium]|nr:hypothetical protein [Tissierellia bacterium]